jgi:hypothetical protein
MFARIAFQYHPTSRPFRESTFRSESGTSTLFADWAHDACQQNNTGLVPYFSATIQIFQAILPRVGTFIRASSMGLSRSKPIPVSR